MNLEKIFNKASIEIKSYTLSDRCFFLFAMLCGFFITAEYAVTKPTSNSIFLTHYSIKYYPLAWICTVPLNFTVISLYNRLIQRFGCLQTLTFFSCVTVFIHTFCGLFVGKYSFLAFFLYVWKDIYVLLMFQQLWSVIHVKTSDSKAKYLYGILFGVSGIGAIFGSCVPSFLAVKLGSEKLLYISLPIYAALIYCYKKMTIFGEIYRMKIGPKSDEKGGFALVFSSNRLRFILFIVVVMQLSTTIMDFQFNSFLQQEFPMQDLRTQFYGRLWGLINTLKLCLQFFATYLIVALIGLRKSHFVVPGILFCNAILILIYPTFSLITYGFSTVKIFDYSIFNILKEMLYVPLTTEEKFKAKSVIDVFAYRSAKALASVFIIGIPFLTPERLPSAYTWGPVCLFLIWLTGVYNHFKIKRKKILEA